MLKYKLCGSKELICKQRKELLTFLERWKLYDALKTELLAIELASDVKA